MVWYGWKLKTMSVLIFAKNSILLQNGFYGSKTRFLNIVYVIVLKLI